LDFGDPLGVVPTKGEKICPGLKCTIRRNFKISIIEQIHVIAANQTKMRTRLHLSLKIRKIRTALASISHILIHYD